MRDRAAAGRQHLVTTDAGTQIRLRCCNVAEARARRVEVAEVRWMGLVVRAGEIVVNQGLVALERSCGIHFLAGAAC